MAKPKGIRPMTATERQHRWRVKQSLLNKEAQTYEYSPTLLFISKAHYEALKQLEASWGNELSTEKLNALVEMAIRSLLKSHKINTPDVNKSELATIYQNAKLSYLEWEQQQGSPT
jgi:hypothetical protein